MKTHLADILRNASQSVQTANPQLSYSAASNAKRGAATAQRRGNMNRCEREFSLILEEQKQRGDILRWEFEGITLRWGGIKYTADFVVIDNFSARSRDFPELPSYSGIKLIEVKGSFIGGKFERAVERFRHARTYWPEFNFELHQRMKQGWKRIY